MCILCLPGMHLEDEEGDDVVFYVMLRAVDRFYEEFNRYPGWYNDQVEADVARLKVSYNDGLWVHISNRGRSVTMTGCGFTSQIEEGQLQ